MMLNKTFYLLLLSLIPLLGFSQANSQYPDSGNKIRLGFQTTGDGLIWRDTQPKVGGYQPINNKAAWIILDTINNKFYHYKNSTWTLAGGQDIDTANLIATKYDLGFKLSLADTGNMLTPYLRKADTTSIAYVNTYGTQTVNGTKTLTSNLILKNSQEPVRDTFVTTQTFAADTTNWTRGAGWTFNGTQAVATGATGDLTYTPSLTITSGNAYEITYTLTNYTGGTLSVRLGNGTAIVLPTYNVTNFAVVTLPTTSTGGFRFTTSSFTGNLDNVRIMQITGSAPVLLAGQDDGAATLYNSLRMPNSTTLAFGGGGARTTGTVNNFFGSNTGQNNTTGLNNNFFGNLAGQFNISGSGNSFFGTQAGRNNITGGQNNFFGELAGLANATGSANNFFGSAAGRSNLTGGDNNFFGTSSGFANTTGGSNNFFGTNSGRLNTTGGSNNFFGVNTGYSNTTGSSNIAIGNAAMYNTTVGDTLAGSNNIAIGTNAGDNIEFAAAGNVAIGNGIDLPDPSGSNQVVIKNIIFATGASGTGTAIAGNVGIGTNAPTARLQVKGSTNALEFALKVDDNSNNNLLSVQNNGDVTLKNPLSVANGGTNTNTLALNKVMVGNGTNGVLTPTNLHWDNTNSALSIGASSPLYKLDVSGTKNFVGVRVSSNNAGDILYYATGTGIGSINLFKSALNYTGTQNFYLQNGNTVSGGSALIIEVDSASTGDAYVNYVSTRATNWSIGLDNSNNDVLTIQPLPTPSTSGTLSGLLTFTTNGKIGVLNKTPTALFHLAAGTATTAPIRLTSGVNLTSPLGGEMEFNGTNLFFSPSTTRHTVNHGLTGSATLDFLSTNAQNSRDMTIAVTGAADGDVVSLGVPNAAVNANTCYTAWVSAANTVTVRFNNYSNGTVDPASGLFKVFVTK